MQHYESQPAGYAEVIIVNIVSFRGLGAGLTKVATHDIRSWSHVLSGARGKFSGTVSQLSDGVSIPPLSGSWGRKQGLEVCGEVCVGDPAGENSVNETFVFVCEKSMGEKFVGREVCIAEKFVGRRFHEGFLSRNARFTPKL
jgi:hypothetical protein